MANFSKRDVKQNYTGVHRKKPVIEHKALNHDLGKERQDLEAFGAAKKKSKCENCMNWFFLPISGIIGGIIAVSLCIAMQRVDFFPFSLLGSHVGEEKALHISETARINSEETMRKLENMMQEMNALKADISSFSSHKKDEFIQGDKILQEREGKFFASLEDKVSSLEESVQSLVRIPRDVETALFIGQRNANDLVALKQKLESMQEEISATSHEKQNNNNVSVFIAVSSLKNAIERGGSYINELKILQQLLPSIDGLDLLQKTAAVGLPNPAKFSADFSSIADAIVGTKNIVASDAGFFEQIFAWIKSLVVSRPVGNVEGMTLEAIAARMEVAIQMGDYEKALAEWKYLPESAKDVSVDFIHKLETYVAVHLLLQQLLMSAQQGSL
ncbi:COG4223 family protein [Bartonella sp. B41]